MIKIISLTLLLVVFLSASEYKPLTTIKTLNSIQFTRMSPNGLYSIIIEKINTNNYSLSFFTSSNFSTPINNQSVNS